MTGKTINPHAPSQADSSQNNRFPWVALLALTMASFITILTETLPAGLLPQITQGLAVSEALVGQLVTFYALGSLVAAIPLTTATQGMCRRPLLLSAIAGFVIANTVTMLSASYTLTMVARFLAGASAGLVWSLLAGYAARMVPDRQKGRAIAVAMVGTPLALSLGVPAGTLLGNLLGWRICFGIMSFLALILMVWVRLGVPDFSGQAKGQREHLGDVFVMPGIRPILFVILAFVLSHNILYTYIAPFLAKAKMVERTDLVLLVFGLASLLSIWLIGILIDSHSRALTLISTLLFCIAALVLGIAGKNSVIIYTAAGMWGGAVGGAATLFQTALFKAAGEAADIAQSMAVTTWNIAIAGGGIAGGVLLDLFGAGVFPPVLLVLLMAALLVIWRAKQYSFPSTLG